MQAKLEQCLDILKSIPSEDAIRIEAMAIFREVLKELDRIRIGIHLLGPRELQVFELIGSGLCLKEIAQKLGIGLKTAETYRGLIREKLRIRNSHDLYYLAFRWMQAKADQAKLAEA